MSNDTKQMKRLGMRSELQQSIIDYTAMSLDCGFNMDSTIDDIIDVVYDATDGKAVLTAEVK